MKKAVPIALALSVAACGLVIDRSMRAVEAGDYTLAMSACEAAPGRGMDICRVKEGAPMDAFWRLILPVGRGVIGGEVTVYGVDSSRSFGITGTVLELSWKEIIGADVWGKKHDGEYLALAKIRWKTPEGIEEIWNARGIAKVVVTAPGYDPLPVDSGFVAWRTSCQIAYSSAGRSAIRCR